MKYWVFHEKQLEAALTAFMLRMHREFSDLSPESREKAPPAVASVIKVFLDSPEAREHKLMGGASWPPEPTAGAPE